MRKENGCKDLSRVLAVRREKYIARERSGRVNRYRPTREVGAHAPEKLTWGICNNNNNDLYAESGQTLQGSFSAVSKQASKQSKFVQQNFASKYSLELGSTSI